MKKIQFFTLLLVLGFTSCSTVKQLHQDKTEVKTEISSLEKTFTESQIVTTTKVTEKKDSILVLPGSELSMATIYSDLLGGDTVYAIGEDLSIKTFYDSLTKTIKTQATVNPRAIHIAIDKTTETSQVATGSVITDKEEQKKETVLTEKIDKQVQHSAFPAWLIFLLIILFISVIGFLILKFRRYL